MSAACTALRPLHDHLAGHVLAAECLYGDDTTVPMLAKGKTTTGRCWTYLRDDRPSAGGRRRRRSSSTRAIARASIPSAIWRRGAQHEEPAARVGPARGLHDRPAYSLP